MNLTADEVELVGRWVENDRVIGAGLQSDATCHRIAHLTGQVLHKIADGNWATLYRDPADGRLWELTGSPVRHGRGPPRLSVLSEEEAMSRYCAVL